MHNSAAKACTSLVIDWLITRSIAKHRASNLFKYIKVGIIAGNEAEYTTFIMQALNIDEIMYNLDSPVINLECIASKFNEGRGK